MKTFKITDNGFIKVFDGKELHIYFYHKGNEKYFIADGYLQV